MFFDLILLLERKIYVILPPKSIGENDSANVVGIVRRELSKILEKNKLIIIGGNMKKMDYETLAMEEIVVEMEDGFLAASKEGKIRKESTIEVEEYVEINNEVSFD